MWKKTNDTSHAEERLGNTASQSFFNSQALRMRTRHSARPWVQREGGNTMPEDMCYNSGPDNELICDQRGTIAIKVDHERLPGDSNIGAVFKYIFWTPNS